jgi:signal transduction histidine kinase
VKRLAFPRLIPRTIAGQVVLLVVLSVVLFHAAMIATHELSSGHEGGRHGSDIGHFADAVRILDELPRTERRPLFAAMARAFPRLNLRLAEKPENGPPHPDLSNTRLEELGRELGPDLAVRTPAKHASGADAHSSRSDVEVVFRDGMTITGALPLSERHGPPAGRLVLGTILFLVLNLAVLLWWALRGLTAPLARFAKAAEGFSLDRDPAPLPEGRGPEEVRVASRALNRMQARIRGMVEDRTRMLAAVGHDLRTPITRMRLRAEFIEDADSRRQLLRDLDQMGAMVHSALAYLRDGRDRQTKSLVDLASLLQTICDDFTDAGETVSYEGPDQVLANLCVEDVNRAVTNLVDNALKHGGTPVDVRLRLATGRDLEVDVIDHGPGIPDERKMAMLEPFARGDAARTMNEETPGFGLGLAIARAAAEAHAGELVLRNAVPSGLIARVRLPVRAENKRNHAPEASSVVTAAE